MIEFELTPKMKMNLDMVHMFAETYIRPYAIQADREGKVPEPFLDACKKFGLGLGRDDAGVE